MKAALKVTFWPWTPVCSLTEVVWSAVPLGGSGPGSWVLMSTQRVHEENGWVWCQWRALVEQKRANDQLTTWAIQKSCICIFIDKETAVYAWTQTFLKKVQFGYFVQALKKWQVCTEKTCFNAGLLCFSCSLTVHYIKNKKYVYGVLTFFDGVISVSLR